LSKMILQPVQDRSRFSTCIVSTGIFGGCGRDSLLPACSLQPAKSVSAPKNNMMNALDETLRLGAKLLITLLLDRGTLGGIVEYAYY